MSEDGLDWMMRPVLENCILYTDLIDGSVGLADVARINDAITVRNENQRRAEASVRKT